MLADGQSVWPGSQADMLGLSLEQLSSRAALGCVLLLKALDCVAGSFWPEFSVQQ